MSRSLLCHYNRWYGSGVYVTEHAGAALRYQYWNTSTPPNRMLVCQVKLGKIFTVPLNSCDYVGKGLSPGYDSHKGRDRWDLADQLCMLFIFFVSPDRPISIILLSR